MNTLPVQRALALLLLLAAPALARAEPFSESWLKTHAQTLSRSAFVPAPRIAPEIQALSYDQMRSLRFLPDFAQWKAERRPFQLQFFHAGGYVLETVDVYTVKKGVATRLPFKPEHFDASQTKLPPEIRAKGGFAGFRAHAAINSPEYLDEVLVFLGASYFRSLGKGQSYGLSARGLAIDTALPTGEEFPRFTTFWVEEPGARSDSLTVHALLDSPRVTGAYRFVVKPGVVTRMDVQATLFPREDIQQLGVAPLTSMYLHGENDRSPKEDFRPEVHDSDGLALWTGSGERLWRPLSNPARLNVASFQVGAVKGFGLLQRDEAFPSYEDLEARYERRPSLWVEPLAGFDDGRVLLVEIPTAEEIHDNIGAM